MISVDVYYQFLPQWAGDILINNLIKSCSSLNLKILNSYIYPNFISVDLDLSVDHPMEIIDTIDDLYKEKLPIIINYNNCFLEKIIEVKDKNELMKNLSDKYPSATLEINENGYKLFDHYHYLSDLIDMIYQRTMAINNFPKNIFWHNLGNNICPRPITGYGYRYKKNQYGIILKGHCFPINNYYNFSWNNVENIEKKLHNIENIITKIKEKYIVPEINENYLKKIITTYYDPIPIIGSIENHQLPHEIIEECLTHHNDSHLLTMNNDCFFLTFINGKNIELDHIIYGYTNTINIRLQETKYYYDMDKNYTMDHWITSLNNIMFFEDKIHWGNKKNTIKILLEHLLTIKQIDYDGTLLEELSWYLLDVNTRLVQEFNNLNGCVGYYLLNFSNLQAKNGIYNFYKKNYEDIYGGILKMANDIYDSTMMLGLGAILTAHKDPYNLKGSIDNWLELLIKYKMNINLDHIFSLLENNYPSIKKFLWKNTLEVIKNRWLLMVPGEFNSMIGFDLWQQWQYKKKLEIFQPLKKRLMGLIKKNVMEQNNDFCVVNDDIIMDNIVKTMPDNCWELYLWLETNEKIINKYLDNNPIKSIEYRHKLIERILKNWK